MRLAKNLVECFQSKRVFKGVLLQEYGVRALHFPWGDKNLLYVYIVAISRAISC